MLPPSYTMEQTIGKIMEMEAFMEQTALIFNIQRFSLHDGNGIRTNVFFQGCNLRCKWCANPESQPMEAEGNGEVRPYTVDALVAELLKDKAFYDKSGGGVTLTGGEPLLRGPFVSALCDALHEKGVTIAAETATNIAPAAFMALLPKFDLLHIDLKHYEEAAHLEGTGSGLSNMLANIRLALASDVRTILRIPVIPGYNDSPEDMRGFAALLKDLGAKEVHLLPFHQMGESKYQKLGLPYAYAGVKQLNDEDLAGFAAILQEAGIQAQIGG